MNRDTSVDFVVPAYGNWRLVERCVEALLKHSPASRVIVVDDASPDPPPAAFLEQTKAIVLSHDVNRGFAAACNTGIRAGTGAFIVLVNSDVIVSGDVAAQVKLAFEGEDEAGSLVVPLLSPDGRLDSFGIVVDRTCAGFVRLHGANVGALSNPELPAAVGPYGALAIYRRAAVEEVGLFDEGIFMYGEELDLALRLANAGWRVIASTQPLGTHIGGATAELGSPKQRYLAGFGRGYILRTYRVLQGPGAWPALVTELIVVVRRLLLFRDHHSLRGRFAGYKAGRSSWRRPVPTRQLDPSITVRQSLQMRRNSYWQDRYDV